MKVQKFWFYIDIPSILIKSSFNCINDKLILWTTKKIVVSSTKSLAIDDRFFDRSMIYTKNNREPKIDPSGMPTSTGDHDNGWPFNKTLWKLFVRKLSKHFSGRSDIPKDCSL